MFVVNNQHLELHACGAVYWKEERILFLADLHLGKAMHFRKKGIPAPLAVAEANLSRLEAVFREYLPERVLFLGDLFHSTYNAEWEAFAELCLAFPQIQFELVRGNHDILPDTMYQNMGLTVHEVSLNLAPFILSHEPLAAIPTGWYGLAGHIHPGVRLYGKGKQVMSFPCFYFGVHQGILPAFGAFTGLGMIKPEPGSQVFVLADGQVIAM